MKWKYILAWFWGISFTMSAMSQTVLTMDRNLKGTMIGPMLYGIFFEEINHAGDGGLYAELIRNRSFEDNTKEPEYWQPEGQAQISLVEDGLLNNAQQRALRISSMKKSKSDVRDGVTNTGYWGIHAVKGRVYRLSFWARSTNYKGTLTAVLKSRTGEIYGQSVLKGFGKQWKKYEARIRCNKDDNEACFGLYLNSPGEVIVDVVSLFPPTYKGRENGLRPDLAQLLAEIRPAFIRFPGGCYVEGEGSYEHAFQWRKTIGRIEERPGHWNYNWGYRSTDGLGFDEYLQMCEDFHAVPLFVVNIGLGHKYVVPMDSLQPYIRDMMDALEYANGDSTTPMGRLRAKNGHPQPYGIKYVELGNENYQAGNDAASQNYAERYELFRKAVVAKYPEMKIVGNVEAWGTDHPSWRNNHLVDLLDEHYYRSYSWMRDNFTKYDSYERGNAQIYVGEYAANADGTYGKNGTIQSALGEAIFMMGMERNGDVCAMSSFAPIFTHEENRTWNYDMIHFTAADVFVTPSYYVQKLFSHYKGTQNILVKEENNDLCIGLKRRKAGVGTWKTKAKYGNFAILDRNLRFVAKESFANTDNWEPMSGDWSKKNMSYCQTSEDEKCFSIYKENVEMDKYEINVDACKEDGEEGFLLVFNYQDSNNYCWWNIGGWGNTESALECCTDGNKISYDKRKFQVKAGHNYQIKLRVNKNEVRGYIDGKEMLHAILPEKKAVYACAALNENNDTLIVKIVNPEPLPRPIQLNFKNFPVKNGNLVQLKSDNASDENTLERKNVVVPTKVEVLHGISPQMNFEAPAFSLSILNIGLEQ